MLRIINHLLQKILVWDKLLAITTTYVTPERLLETRFTGYNPP